MMHSEQANQENVEILKNKKALQEMERLERLRKENDNLRRKIIQKLDQQFKMLMSFNQAAQKYASQDYISTAANEQYVEKILSFLRQSKNFLQTQNTAKAFQQQQLDKQIRKNISKLHEIEYQNQRKQSIIEKITSNIKQKTFKLNQLQQELYSVLDEYRILQQQLVQKKVNQNSVESITLDEIQKNWQMQRAYILALVDQRTLMRKQLILLEKANKLLEQKVHQQSNQLLNFQQRRRTIDDLKIRNQHLKNELNQQKRRQQNLQQMKLTLVIEKQSNLATNIVQKWDGQKRNCQNLLLTIIQRVNRQLPYKKLEDVNEIIRAAEEQYRKKESGRRQQNNSRMMMEQGQQMMEEGQPQQYQI